MQYSLCVALYLNGWIVFIHKVVLDELNGESALADATSTDHHQLVLRHLSFLSMSTRERKKLYIHRIICLECRVDRYNLVASSGETDELQPPPPPPFLNNAKQSAVVDNCKENSKKIFLLMFVCFGLIRCQKLSDPSNVFQKGQWIHVFQTLISTKFDWFQEQTSLWKHRNCSWAFWQICKRLSEYYMPRALTDCHLKCQRHSQRTACKREKEMSTETAAWHCNRHMVPSLLKNERVWTSCDKVSCREYYKIFKSAL